MVGGSVKEVRSLRKDCSPDSTLGSDTLCVKTTCQRRHLAFSLHNNWALLGCLHHVSALQLLAPEVAKAGRYLHTIEQDENGSFN